MTSHETAVHFYRRQRELADLASRRLGWCMIWAIVAGLELLYIVVGAPA